MKLEIDDDFVTAKRAPINCNFRNVHKLNSFHFSPVVLYEADGWSTEINLSLLSALLII